MLKKGYLRKAAILFFVIPALGFFISNVCATDQYASETGKGCAFCHQESSGGPLKTAGFAYIKNGYTYPIPDRILRKAERLQAPFHKTLRFIIGYFHLLAATVFFGAIFYIHIFVGAKNIRGGIPKPERILGVSCMGTLAITGVYLTWVRIDNFKQFFNNTFGLMLFIKILLFLLMMFIAGFAITIVHKKMKGALQSRGSKEQTSKMTLDDLERFDGASGNPAYVVYENKIYDMTKSKKWKNGRHAGKHMAGADLTDALKNAPHGTEVLENVKYMGTVSKRGSGDKGPTGANRIFLFMAYANLIIIFLILGCISIWRWGFPIRLIPEKRQSIIIGHSCTDCHEKETPGIFRDWSESVHAMVGVECYTCHRPDPNKPFISRRHLEHDAIQVSTVVTPKTCGGCHPKEAAQYRKSKHANTLEIIWKVDKWLNDNMNSAIERSTGCYACHGTVVEVRDGKPVPGSWPNVGVGRKNPDATLGCCSSCHTRHKFSIMEARKPEACDQCHLGPDHPQIEIYNESKHGTIYHSEGDSWNWVTDDGAWKAGRDFRAPTCAACHMSAAGGVQKTHDVTERLSWETQAPFTVRPNDFKPFPATTDWQEEREKMKTVCLQCHSEHWTDSHFSNLDEVVRSYNEDYFLPIQKKMDDLYGKGLLSKDIYFDEDLEWQFYELWHHEGRRARMGAAMMAPDYAWWHGFYELKHRFNHILKESEALERSGKTYRFKDFPGKYK